VGIQARLIFAFIGFGTVATEVDQPVAKIDGGHGIFRPGKSQVSNAENSRNLNSYFLTVLPRIVHWYLCLPLNENSERKIGRTKKVIGRYERSKGTGLAPR
jgi:hypothetical protein